MLLSTTHHQIIPHFLFYFFPKTNFYFEDGKTRKKSPWKTSVWVTVSLTQLSRKVNFPILPKGELIPRPVVAQRPACPAEQVTLHEDRAQGKRGSRDRGKGYNRVGREAGGKRWGWGCSWPCPCPCHCLGSPNVHCKGGARSGITSGSKAKLTAPMSGWKEVALISPGLTSGIRANPVLLCLLPTANYL